MFTDWIYPTIRDVQTKAIKWGLELLQFPVKPINGFDRNPIGVMEIGTGAGKTACEVYIANNLSEKTQKPFLISTPRILLRKQIIDECEKFGFSYTCLNDSYYTLDETKIENLLFIETQKPISEQSEYRKQILHVAYTLALETQTITSLRSKYNNLDDLTVEDLCVCQKATRLVSHSNIVVCTHARILNDYKLRKMISNNEFCGIIFDEAHMLTDSAALYVNRNLNSRDIEIIINNVNSVSSVYNLPVIPSNILKRFNEIVTTELGDKAIVEIQTVPYLPDPNAPLMTQHKAPIYMLLDELVAHLNRFTKIPDTKLTDRIEVFINLINAVGEDSRLQYVHSISKAELYRCYFKGSDHVGIKTDVTKPGRLLTWLTMLKTPIIFMTGRLTVSEHKLKWFSNTIGANIEQFHQFGRTDGIAPGKIQYTYVDEKFPRYVYDMNGDDHKILALNRMNAILTCQKNMFETYGDGRALIICNSYVEMKYLHNMFRENNINSIIHNEYIDAGQTKGVNGWYHAWNSNNNSIMLTVHHTGIDLPNVRLLVITKTFFTPPKMLSDDEYYKHIHKNQIYNDAALKFYQACGRAARKDDWDYMVLCLDPRIPLMRPYDSIKKHAFSLKRSKVHPLVYEDNRIYDLMRVAMPESTFNCDINVYQTDACTLVGVKI